jgi:hypothetical protein
MKKLAVCIAALAVAFAANTGTSNACIHPPKSLPAIDNGAQRGMLFWHDGYQHLVMQPGYSLDTEEMDEDKFTDDGMVKGFDKIAWLIPVPNMPDLYEEAPATIFKDLDKFTEVTARIPDEKPEHSEGPTIDYTEDGEEEGIEFHEAIDVGDYSIQPLKATGEKGQVELASWLKTSGFAELDDRIIRFYVERDYVWLAVKLSPEGNMKPDGDLEPLHVAYKSKAPSYPLKINDKGGRFNIELWVVTKDEIDLTKSKHFGLTTPEQHDDFFLQKNRHTPYGRLPESLRGLIKEDEKMKEARKGKIWIYRLQGRGIEDEEGLDLGMLQEDLHFEFIKDAAEKPKSEVKVPEDKPEEGEGEDSEDKPEDTEDKPE